MSRGQFLRVAVDAACGTLLPGQAPALGEIRKSERTGQAAGGTGHLRVAYQAGPAVAGRLGAVVEELQRRITGNALAAVRSTGAAERTAARRRRQS
jgi:hypothetical protein